MRSSWCVDLPCRWENYIDVEMWRHPDHVVIISWDTDQSDQPYGMVRIRPAHGCADGLDFDDGRYLPTRVVSQLVALVKKERPEVCDYLERNV